MSQQQFDWKHSPANDLRRALQQAQLSLEEISENKFLESLFREGSQFGTDQFGKNQSAQYADAEFDMNLNENHRWDYDSKRDAYLNEDDVEETNNIQSDCSEEVAAEDPL